jgi:3-dehydroquinate synthase
MQKKTFRFSNSSVDYYFNSGLSQIRNLVDRNNSIFITDENVFAAHKKKFAGWNTIVLKAGEAYKIQPTVDSVIEQLIEMEADRNTMLVGIGGGVITDLTGYIASIYMRGIGFGFVPASLLAMVDASIGGKNGIDVGVYKNMVGVIRQPRFILYDYSFLSSLPRKEWRNGFAEIIKHAAIKNAAMFRELESNSIDFYQKKKLQLDALVQKNAMLKTKLVQEDEFEKGIRKHLNFGHTLGHALENQYELSHGEAISIGMAYAAALSEQLSGFAYAEKIIALIERYELPAFAEFDRDKVINVLKMDKKKAKGVIQFILLEKIGRAVIKNISINQLYQAIG